MAQIFSNAHIDVVIDGSHRIEGWADEDRPYEMSERLRSVHDQPVAG